MAAKLVFAFLIFSLAGLAFSTPEQDVGLNNFINLHMANYSSWVKNNELDPSPIFERSESFLAVNQVANLNVSLRNQGVRGHSNDVRVTNITTVVGGGIIFVNEFFIDFEARGNVTFFGEYSVTGTVNSTIPVSAEGAWNITVPTVYLNTTHAFFLLHDDGFFRSFYMFKNLHFGNERVYDLFFENLLDNEGVAEFEEDIRDALYDGFAEFIALETDKISEPLPDPLRRSYIDYWTQILRRTTYEEIFATTMPPTTTAPNTTPTTN